VEDLEKLQQYEKTRSKTRLPETVKPCLMSLIAKREKLEGDQAFILACELQRVGKQPKRIEGILDSLHVRESKVRSIVRSLKRTDYKYNCPALEDRGLCLYQDHKDCWWWRRRPDKNKKDWEEKDFYRYGWQKRLRLTEERLYTTLRAIEIKRGWPAGSRLFVTWDELYEESRISRDTIGEKLKVLKDIGLIKYRPGEERVKGSKARATEVTRIIPIPRPSNGQKENIDNGQKTA